MASPTTRRASRRGAAPELAGRRGDGAAGAWRPSDGTSPSAHLTVAASPAVAAVFRETDRRASGSRDRPARRRPARPWPCSRAKRFDVGHPVSQLVPVGVAVLAGRRFRERWGYADGRARPAAHAAGPTRVGASGCTRPTTTARSCAGLGVPGRRRRAAAPRGAPTRAAGAPTPCSAGTRSAPDDARWSASRRARRTARRSSGRRTAWPRWPRASCASMASHCVLVGASHDRAAARAIESWVRANAPEVKARVVEPDRTHEPRRARGRHRPHARSSSRTTRVRCTLAAALGRPVVAVFGPTDERVTRPLGDRTG